MKQQAVAESDFESGAGALLAAAVLTASLLGLGCSPPRLAPMVEVSAGVYVDPATRPEDRQFVLHAVESARRRIGDSFGGLRAETWLLFCHSADCRSQIVGPVGRAHLIGPNRPIPGTSYGGGPHFTAIIDVIEPRTPGIGAHELAHAEVAARSAEAFLPAWFDEGAATLVADAPSCSPDLPRGIDDLRELTSRQDMAEHTRGRESNLWTYCQARRELEAWGAREGTDPRERVRVLLDSLAQGAPFAAVYGPLATQQDTLPPESSGQMWLSGAIATFRGTADSHLRMDGVTELTEGARAFSLSVWVRPSPGGGVLAHLSEAPDGGGWCTPLLGFDRSGALVAQLLSGHTPDLSSYRLAVHAPGLEPDAWTHVAVTWSRGDALRLYVGGQLVHEIEAPTVHLPRQAHLTWGSGNLAGADACWPGAIDPGPFAGSMSRFSVTTGVLEPEALAALAAGTP
jgi:hypothetical protein